MICNHCKNNIPDSAAICPVCGARAAEPIRDAQDRVLKKVGVDKVQFLTYAVSAAVFFLLFAYFLSNYITGKSEMDSSWFSSSNQRNALAYIGLWTVAFAVFTIQCLVRAVVYHKMSLCVCENTVYGIGGKSMLFASEPFQFSYGEILSVSKGRQHTLVLETRSRTCKCVIAERDEMIRLIQERISNEVC